MVYVASSYASLSRLVEETAEAAVVLDTSGEVVLYNQRAAHFADAKHVEGHAERDLVPFDRVLLGETISRTPFTMDVHGRAGVVELDATLHPVRSSVGAVIAVLAVQRPSMTRSRATLRRAAVNFLAAARADGSAGAMVFDRDLRVVAACGTLASDPHPLCQRAIDGEVCREPGCDDCELRSGPIRDSFGLIVGGVVVSYESGPSQP